MPFVMSESIHYSPVGAKDALDKIRQFALSLGWTIDYWNTTDGVGLTDYYLQLWSPGYVAQEMCYRLYVTNVDAQEDTLSIRAVVPGQRYNQSNKIASSTSTWGGNTTTYYNVSLPAAAFDALYLYGTKRFIAAIFHIDPIAVATVVIGTWDLLPSWWYYGPGLNFWFTPQDSWSTSSSYKWYNISANPSFWSPPMTQKHANTQGYNVWYEGSKRYSIEYACNFRPSSSQLLGAESGDFNRANRILAYNSFTNKRTAFQSTFFVRHPSLLIWYPVGVSPFAWVNGRGLSIGEVVTFGADQYRCFPGVFSTYEQWQAYRIS